MCEITKKDSVQFVAEYRPMRIKTFLVIHDTVGEVVVVTGGEVVRGWCPCCMDHATRDGIVRLARQATEAGEIVGKVKWVQFAPRFFGKHFGSDVAFFEEGLDAPQIPKPLLDRVLAMAALAGSESPKS